MTDDLERNIIERNRVLLSRTTSLLRCLIRRLREKGERA